MTGDADQGRPVTVPHLKKEGGGRHDGRDPQVLSDDDDIVDGLDFVDQYVQGLDNCE